MYYQMCYERGKNPRIIAIFSCTKAQEHLYKFLLKIKILGVKTDVMCPIPQKSITAPIMPSLIYYCVI